MSVLLWLVVPLGVTILAIGWVHWAARPRGPVETHESLAAYERFKRAMDAPVRAPKRSPERRAS